jgi:hypothetical protein
MSTKPVKLASKLLQEIASESSSSPVETISCLLEILESKEDPESDEIYLISNLYQTLEKVKLLESHLRSYVNGDKVHRGNKLADLYDKLDSYGSSKLFK